MRVEFNASDPTEDTVPFYHSFGDEVQIAEQAARAGLPVMLVGPTGCGKSRFIQHMAARLKSPLVTVVGNDDTTTADLVGRYLVHGGDVDWNDGPLTRAARSGSVFYLDEVVEVRREALAILHPLADDRQQLFLERTGETVQAAPGFALFCSYNPSRSIGFKELRAAFRQRFVTLALDYLPPEAESNVIATEAEVEGEIAARLAKVAATLREGLGPEASEVPSTRQLISAAQLTKRGIDEKTAINVSVIDPLIHGGQTSREALIGLTEAIGI